MTYHDKPEDHPETEQDAKNRPDATPRNPGGIASRLQPGGTAPGGGPGASVGSVGTGGGQTGGAPSGSVKRGGI